MKKIYFKIFELPTHQVCIQRDFGNEDGEKDFLIVVQFYFDGILAKQSLGYDDENKRDQDFDKFDEKVCQNMVDAVSEMFKK